MKAGFYKCQNLASSITWLHAVRIMTMLIIMVMIWGVTRSWGWLPDYFSFLLSQNIEGRLDTYEEYGRNNTVLLTLRRYIGFFGSITVNWQTTSINAINLDFSPSFGSVQFEDGQETADIAITIIDDKEPEEMEVNG